MRFNRLTIQPFDLEADMQTEKLLQQKDVSQVTSCSRATIYRGVRAGTFPAPVRITERRVAWRETDVQAWIQSLGEVA